MVRHATSSCCLACDPERNGRPRCLGTACVPAFAGLEFDSKDRALLCQLWAVLISERAFQVLGGTGRVGGSTAEALLAGQSAETLQILVAGRSKGNYTEAQKKRPRLSEAQFLHCDIDNPESVRVRVCNSYHPTSTCRLAQELHSSFMDVLKLSCAVERNAFSTACNQSFQSRAIACTSKGKKCTGVQLLSKCCRHTIPAWLQAALQDADLCIHAAGPFQRKGSCAVLEAAIELRVPYVDVCDDVEYTEETKKLHQRAVDAGVPCITSAGIYPGEHCSLFWLTFQGLGGQLQCHRARCNQPARREPHGKPKLYASMVNVDRGCLDCAPAAHAHICACQICRCVNCSKSYTLLAAPSSWAPIILPVVEIFKMCSICRHQQPHGCAYGGAGTSRDAT